MCKYCEKEENILQTKVISSDSFGWGNTPIIEKDIIEDALGVFIDKRDIGSFLRLVDLGDCNCLEAGEKIEIKFCPFCGSQLNKLKG